jgi:hypothetical protein
MARLTAAARRALPKSAFLVPSKAPGPGSYPVPDAKHRAVAKGLAAMHGHPAIAAKAEKRIAAHKGHKTHGVTVKPPMRHKPMAHGFTRGPQHHS